MKTEKVKHMPAGSDPKMIKRLNEVVKKLREKKKGSGKPAATLE